MWTGKKLRKVPTSRLDTQRHEVNQVYVLKCTRLLTGSNLLGRFWSLKIINETSENDGTNYGRRRIF